MERILLILPSTLEKSETFIKDLVFNLTTNSFFKFYYVYPSPKLTIQKFKSIIKLPIYLNRVILYKKSNPEFKFLKTGYHIYLNLEILTAYNISVVHYLFSNLAVGKENLAKIIGAKNSIGLRGFDITYYGINHPNSYSDSFWKSIDSIQANSFDLYEWALKWGANKEIPIKIINAAVNDEFILDLDNLKTRRKLDPIKLIFVGRLHWKKGLDTLFRVFIKLLKTQNALLEVVGDGPEIEKIRFLIKKFNINDKVVLRGKMSQIQILKCFDQSDILLAPSIQEGCSNVVLEAQARGLYCIVSDAEGMNEVVENRKTGVLCDIWDQDQWVNEIISYSMFDYKHRLELSTYSILRINQFFKRSKQVDDWNSYFKGVCSNS